ncbi:MAG: DUF1080 domain-containing protein [Verrucomicrobia bacterium]|nr:DUF1080 domain-containing protein [Verrucomicrobiota bacterium]MCF7709189.1 DUF1080 domain-containing protein [Verrucomicrobiota bacterium]
MKNPKKQSSLKVCLAQFISLTLAFSCLAANESRSIELTANPDNVTAQIDEKIYGHFLEHIYHSVNGGLWGELVWNRSFEEVSGEGVGIWSVSDGLIQQESLESNVRLWFGNPEWKDYIFTLQAKKTGGSEGFLVLFRGINDEEFYWYNLGGWGNQRHALEKGNKGERWGTVGPSSNGQIAENHWYDIKVRCEGNHIQVWLDGERVLNYRDTDNPHLRGRVGIGTWSTKAVFRDIKVTSLNGDLLLSGLPEIKEQFQVARHWEPVGEGEFSIAGTDSLNSRVSQYVRSKTGRTGIRQKPFKMRKNDSYAASLWLRGDAPDGLVFSITESNRVLFETELPAPSPEWREYAFNFSPSLSADKAALSIELGGEGSVYIDQVSIMPESSEQTGGYRSDLLGAVADLQPPVIRWPGGCFASPYRWKDGIGPQHERFVTPRKLWDDLDVNSFGTDEFIRMCHKMGAEPIIVVNIGTENWNGEVDQDVFLQDVLDWIEYCNGPVDSEWGSKRAANGHPEPYNVKYWEIDNETWHMGAEAYVEAVRKFASAMREKDPGIVLFACGSGGFNLEWNRRIIEGCADLIDYLSIHHYENPDRFAEGPYNYEEFIKQTAEIIEGSSNPELKIYCSEWNVQSTDWRTGLYAGGVLNAFERCAPVFEIGGPALFLRHVSAGAWDNAFINFDNRSWFPAPNYVVMKLWREYYAPNRIELEGNTDALNTVATASGNGERIIVKCVNPSEGQLDVELTVEGNFVPNSANLELVAPGELEARNTLSRPNRISPEPGIASIQGRTIRFELPPLSAGVLSVKR